MRLASSSSASVSVSVVTNSIVAVAAIMRAMRFDVAREPRVVRDALLEVPRLADVEHLALGVDHAVDAGAVRRVLPVLLDDRRRRA